MTTDVFRFSMLPEVPVKEAEMTLQLATFAAEGLFGPSRIRLNLSYHLDAERQAILIDGTTKEGSSVIRIFTGLLIREFGENSFRVERLRSVSQPAKEVLS